MSEIDVPLDEREAAADPFAQFERWYAEARTSAEPQPNAMALATATRDGRPAVRMVLLNGFDARGFVFFTNYESAKAADLAVNPRAALAFHWPLLHRQVRAGGEVARVGRDESEAYWATRPAGSRISAAASRQSRVIDSREELEAAVSRLSAEHPEGPPLPGFWGGYRLTPEEVEFWQGRPNRLHDRLRYRLEDGGWRVERLAP